MKLTTFAKFLFALGILLVASLWLSDWQGMATAQGPMDDNLERSNSRVGTQIRANPDSTNLPSHDTTSHPVNTEDIQAHFFQLPLSFIPNVGQINSEVRFLSRGLGGTLYFKPDEVLLALPTPVDIPDTQDAPTNHPVQPTIIRLHFEDANLNPEIAAAERLPGIVNYFVGNDPTKWQTDIPTHKGIIYRDLYPGIDLHYDGTEGLLKGTYIVTPGADPSLIRWRYQGARNVQIDEATGNLDIEGRF